MAISGSGAILSGSATLLKERPAKKKNTESGSPKIEASQDAETPRYLDPSSKSPPPLLRLAAGHFFY